MNDMNEICQCAKCNEAWSHRMTNSSRQKREEFRAKLADLGRSEETIFSSKVLEAYDLVHCPELREIPIVINITNNKKVLIQRHGRFIYQD